MLIGQRASTTSVYFIRSGIVKCTFAEDQDKEYILEFLGEGDPWGEIEAICKTPAMSSVRAISELSTYMMDKTSFLDLLGQACGFQCGNFRTDGGAAGQYGDAEVRGSS